MWHFLEGLGGTVHGRFFFFPTSSSSSSSSSAAKASPSPLNHIHQCTVNSQLRNYITLNYVIYTPNLVWFLLALVLWFLVPYPLTFEEINESIRTNQTRDFVMTLFQQRLCINLIMVWTYYGFWHVALYAWHWGQRPWIPPPQQASSYRFSKVMHNAWYTTLGTIQWTLTETALLYITYIQPLGQQHVSSQKEASQPVCSASDHPNASSSSNTIGFTLLTIMAFGILVPAIRDVHFYVAHRFLHARFLYKYIHALHHRNTTEVEPFSGLSMHPTEHLYYFTCYGPWLAVMACWRIFYNTSGATTSASECQVPLSQTPLVLAFGLFWMGLHVLLSPAASHSGFEDHWQADLYHYLHHRYFDCNFASPALPFDKWMGTFRDRLADVDDKDDDDDDQVVKNKDEKEPKDPSKTFKMTDPKASVMLWDGGLPTREEVAFYVLGVALPVSVLVYAYRSGVDDDAWWPSKVDHQSVAMLLAIFPLVTAALLHAWSFRRTATKGSWWKHYMAPFHQDSYLSLFLHFGMGAFFCCILPLYGLLSALLAKPRFVSNQSHP